MANHATPSPDPTPSPAETLRRAAERIRETQSIFPPRFRDEFELAVADWLDHEANRVDEMVEATQRPSRGVDEPSAIYYRDPAGARGAAASHPAFAHAYTVARAYLDEAR